MPPGCKGEQKGGRRARHLPERRALPPPCRCANPAPSGGSGGLPPTSKIKKGGGSLSLNRSELPLSCSIGAPSFLLDRRTQPYSGAVPLSYSIGAPSLLLPYSVVEQQATPSAYRCRDLLSFGCKFRSTASPKSSSCAICGVRVWGPKPKAT